MRRVEATAGAERALDGLVARQQDMFGVIDIGSNSLRLVLYDRLSRAPTVLFNEKVMCALGRGLDRTGRLNPEGVVLARANMERFVLLTRQLGVSRLDVIATSAVRDAEDGPQFVAEMEERCGIRITVIDGDREGRLSASGVRAGIADAEGLTGDLGGGSVELAVTGPDSNGNVVSLPIGPLRFLTDGIDDARPRAAIQAAVDSVPWLPRSSGKPFYAVGGSWRALARIHMEQELYPLHIIHHYTIPYADAERFLSLVVRQSRRSLERVVGVSRRRLETLPLAGHVLRCILQAVRPSEVVFSGYGLREGHLFEQLSPADQRQDPLLEAATQIAASNPRFGDATEELLRWAAQLIEELPKSEHRLVRAVATLSDIGWSEHPDYRAEQVFLRCLTMPVPGIDHHGRVFVAASLHARYGGEPDAEPVGAVRRLLDERAFDQARAVGQALRLAYTLTGGAPGLIGRTSLLLEDDALVLSIPERTAIFTGEAVQRRLDAVGRTLGRRTVVRIAAPGPKAV